MRTVDLDFCNFNSAKSVISFNSVISLFHDLKSIVNVWKNLKGMYLVFLFSFFKVTF